jgi:hypothetical protein
MRRQMYSNTAGAPYTSASPVVRPASSNQSFEVQVGKPPPPPDPYAVSDANTHAKIYTYTATSSQFTAAPVASLDEKETHRSGQTPTYEKTKRLPR